MASFGALHLGDGTTVTADDPRATFEQGDFGGNVLWSIDGGGRGRRTLIAGQLAAPTSLALATAEAVFRSHNDGQARTLTDNLGVTWPNVVLTLYRPLGRVRQTPAGIYYRAYRAEFLHLS